MSSTSATTSAPQPGGQAITSGISDAEHAVMNAAAGWFLERHSGHDAGLATAVTGSLRELTQAAAPETAPCAAHRDDYHRGHGSHLFY